ncbi:MAG: hypothetical protein V3V19_00155 [Cocleimonas sp.]
MKLKWDHYSDQPDIIRDKGLKKQIYKQVRWDSLKLLLTNLIFYPISLLYYFVVPTKKQQPDTKVFFGMSINLDKSPEQTRTLVDDLQVTSLLIRMPLHDIENIEKYVSFAEKFSDKDLLVNILQDRRHIEDLSLAKQSIQEVFEKFSHLSNRFQIGNAINRKKWAIFSMEEYLHFYKVAYDLKQRQYPKLVLLGASVIDFEYYFTVRTLFNLKKVRFDECSSLLYVDRRGAPENTQIGFNLQKKLFFLQAILRLSPKSASDIVITETNWPIKNTAPYAPTSNTECIDLESHANYLVRYYLLALSTGVVKNVYWHQLIASGYGLVDNREDKLIKYPSYYAFKVMLSLLQGARFIDYKEQAGLYRVSFEKNESTIEAVWSLHKVKLDVKNKTLISRDGNQSQDLNTLEVGASPVYLIGEK